MATQSLLALITSQAISSPQSAALVLLLFLVAVVYLGTPRSRAEKLLRKLPTPPMKLPIVGHLHLIGSLPHRSLCDLAKKHGPDVLLLRLGAVPTLVVSSPRAARAVLRTHDHHFASRPFSAVADILFNGHTDVAFAPYGDYWRQTRKVVTTHLLTPKKVRASRAAREQEVRLVLDRVRRAAAAAAAAAEAVDLSEVFSFFANDIVCQAVVGRFPREQGRNEMFREMLETNAKLLGGFNLEDYFPSLGRLSLVTAKALKHKKKWDEFLDNLIDTHASVKVEEGQEEDFIDVLLSVQEEYNLTRDNIKAILMDMFEAGTDTTYIALDYAMAELMRKPEAMAKLQAEVRSCTGKGKEMVTEEDLSKMTYIKAVMKESMRLHAPGPLLIPHFCTDDCDVEGYTIPAGTRVLLNVWSIGRDPTCWESAEEFIPERFMKEGTDADSDFQGNDFRFLPFGSGRRICPAINFTTATFEIILSNLIYHFNWKLPPGTTDIDMTESFGMDVHRKENLLLIPSLA